jgi:CHASE2 domain-containing sensor protein
MELQMVGAACIGLVWGSLLAAVARQVRRPVWSALWLSLATLLVAATLALVAGSSWILIGFASAVATAAWLQAGWYQELRKKRSS